MALSERLGERAHSVYLQVMVRRYSAVARTLVAALALFQAGAPSLAAFADSPVAPLGAASSHIEDHTRRNCTPVHPDDCAPCRFLSITAPPSDRAASLADSGCSTGIAAIRTITAAASGGERLQRSRAPPLA
ncbi:MAG: hypothetical protein CK531_09475 [Gemmatimonadetes bacterium]|nr:MAG: hypothetical protein CK531_09475 [Gemmatimonadota bacterium]